MIGSQFDADLLSCLVDDVDVTELKSAEFIDQVTFTVNGEYVFRHPLIRAVAYESQLKSDRADLHRKLAAAIEERDRDSLEANATLVAQHLEAAGDLQAAYDWRMRAAAWAQFREVGAARTSWQSARDVADRLPTGDPNKIAKQIRPRTALCASAFRFSGSIEDIGFDDLCELCRSNGGDVSLGLGLAGLMTGLLFHNRFSEAARVAGECTSLLASMVDQTLTFLAFTAAGNVKFQAGEVSEGLRLSQRAFELSDGDPLRDNTILGSPLAVAYGLNGVCRLAMGMSGWRDEFDRGATIAKSVDLTSHVAGIVYKYWLGTDLGALRTDSTALADPGFVLHDLPRLRMRALLAKAYGDEAAYRGYRDRYRAMANELGFEGHIAVAEAMFVT